MAHKKMFIIVGFGAMFVGAIALAHMVSTARRTDDTEVRSLTAQVKDTLSDITVRSKNTLIDTIDRRTPEDKLRASLTGEGSVQCAIASDDLTGELYISDGKTRFSGSIPETAFYPAMTDILARDDTTYMWNADTKTGYTFHRESELSEDSLLALNPDQIEQLDMTAFTQEIQRLGIQIGTCESVSEDELFAVPDEVEFKPFEDQFQEYLLEKAKDAINKGLSDLFEQ